jgi:hypothetical protein
MALMLVQGNLFPLIQGVCSLSFSFQQACLAYGLYKGVCSLCLLFSKLVLLLIWSRDFVPFSLYCWSPAHFWSIIFLHLIKKERADHKELSVEQEREAFGCRQSHGATVSISPLFLCNVFFSYSLYYHWLFFWSLCVVPSWQNLRKSRQCCGLPSKTMITVHRDPRRRMLKGPWAGVFLLLSSAPPVPLVPPLHPLILREQQ